MRLIHVSDLHFGPHYMHALEERLLGAIANLKPDTVVITGDLTQRARQNEFRAAAAFLQKLRGLTAHIVVCPGNHDIPMYRFWERLITPFRRYRRHIHTRLDYAEAIDGATLVALNSVRPYSRLVEGRLNSRQFSLCQEAFAKAPSGDFHILAAHHPIGMTEQGFHHPSLKLHWPQLCQAQRLDIILTGHVHQPAVVPYQPPGCPHPLLLISCGTTTSNRGRGEAKLWNNFHLLDGSADELRVESYRLTADQPHEAYALVRYPRQDSGAFSFPV